MALSVRNDPSRPSGGHAILEGPNLAGVASLSLENVYSGLFLSGGGRWAKLPHAFAVGAAPGDAGALRLGPDIVDHVPSDLQLALRSGDGRDLGRLFWLDIVPSRSSPAPAPPAAFEAPPPSIVQPLPPLPLIPPPPPPEPPTASAEPTVLPSPGPAKGGVARRWLPAAALLLVAAGGVAFALLRRDALAPSPAPTPVAEAKRCADGFGGKVAAVRGAGSSDEDRVRLAEDALGARCGGQAFAALDGADWEASEPAAWHLARFYDPNETDPAVRAAATPHPDWAASYYARWAGRNPRDAAALKLLCGTDGATLGDNAQIKRACAR